MNLLHLKLAIVTSLAQPRRPLVVLSHHHCGHLPSHDPVGLLRWVKFVIPK
jgi:hypothetical protein